MPQGLRPAAYEALGMAGRQGGAEPEGRQGPGRWAITPKGASSFGGHFILDPVTYEFLGCRDERTSGDGNGMKRNTRLSYLDSWAIVDKVKQLPTAAG